MLVADPRPRSDAGEPLKAVVLNHTGYEHHHGCRTVMSVIYSQLAARGFRVIAASPVRHKWWRDTPLMRAISKADLIVINGEGTLHDGAGHGAKLLQVVDHPARGKAPVVLINALYESNPREWRRYLDRLAFISVRDSRSQAELKALGYDAYLTPDYSMAGEASASARVADLVGFGDSVSRSVSADLLRLYRAHVGDARFVPIWSSLRYWAFADLAPLFYAANTVSLLGAATARLGDGRARWYASEQDFMAGLAQLGLYVTGRFHGAALALRTGTPFLTSTSNSGKNEALIADAGLNPARLVDFKALNQVRAADWAYSAEEVAAISAYRARATAGANAVFDRLAELVRTPAPGAACPQ